MFAAMSSRMPKGGIQARYRQVLEEVADGLIREGITEFLQKIGTDHNEEGMAEAISVEIEKHRDSWLEEAEDRLCKYPMHPRIQKFFDRFVAKYGHSSIMELTGDPAVYTEGISWYDAFLLFDSPLCEGQEFSTRAVRHKDWPIALSAKPDSLESFQFHSEPGHPRWILEELHEEWMEIFEAEVTWWTEHLKDPANREALGIAVLGRIHCIEVRRRISDA